MRYAHIMVMERSRVYENLREVGIDEAVALRLAEVVQEDRSQIATKADLDNLGEELRGDIKEAVDKLDIRIRALDEKIDLEIASVRREIASVRRELDQLRHEIIELRRGLDERDERLRREFRWAVGIVVALFIAQMGITIGLAVA